MSDTSTWPQIWKINGRFLRATFCAGFAWLCWQGYLAGIGWLGLFAVMFACGALIHGVIALFGAIRMIVGSFKWRRFKRTGVAPKADPVARETDLRKAGLIR